jgi:PAS domain-containing protein
MLDAGLRWERINGRLATVDGFPVPAHIGKRIRDLMQALADAVEPTMRTILETGKPRLDVEVPDHTPNGDRTLSASWLPVKDAQGNVTGINVVVQDMTERKRT